MNNIHVHVPCHKIESYSGFLNEHKLNLEIYFPASTLDILRKGDIEQIMGSLNYKPALSIHAPFMDLSPGAVDSKVRLATTERFSHIMDIAEMLCPAAIVFHSGYEKWKYNHNADIWIENSIRTWEPLIEKAAGLGVKLAIENIFEDEPSTLQALMEKLGSETFGICFDTGHCNLFTKVPATHWIESLRPYLVELHLHDNDKTADLHQPPGDGTFDFNALFSTLANRNHIYTIEAHTPGNVLKSIESLKNYVIS